MILKNWKLDKPRSGTAKEWADWERENKAKYPIRYFLQERLPIILSVSITRRITDFYWYCMHRVHPNHRYNIMDTGLPPNYYDPRTRMINACFHDLTKFVNYTEKTNYVDWNSDPVHKSAWENLRWLRNWWAERPDRDDFLDEMYPLPEIPKEWGWMAVMNEDYDNEPVMIEWKRIADIHSNARNEWDKEDKEMFTRLVEFREFMWYG